MPAGAAGTAVIRNCLPMVIRFRGGSRVDGVSLSCGFYPCTCATQWKVALWYPVILVCHSILHWLDWCFLASQLWPCHKT